MFRGDSDNGSVDADVSVPEEDGRFLGWQTAWRVLPYRMQDSYSRHKTLQDLSSLVLENAFLKATFLPQYGGRLVSLLHKPSGRELLARNPVFQPANLALRNAWFSGGIEWNAGQPGHHYRTCSPVFAARVRGPDGTPVLRLYEWDRVKGFTWQTDFWLPDTSQHLFARTRLVNPHGYELSMYWWTNIAVAEREDIRVLVPASTALCNPYWTSLQVVPLPVVRDYDITYTTRVPHAADFFSRIEKSQRPWIAALDGQGKGLFETSTERLRGRKLFCWGNGRGGRRWQEFLAAPGHAYLEIQAGLARTQMECLPMPADSEWTFTEVFGLLEAPPKQVHGEDWEEAWRTVDLAIAQAVPPSVMACADSALASIAGLPPDEILWSGSGWGALERERCRLCGEPDPMPQGLVFDEGTIGPEQEPWLRLLQDGRLPERDPRGEPGALMTQEEWRGLLERSVERQGSDHWVALWHLGNMRMEAREINAAVEAWQRSLERQPTSWALRNLAVASQRQGNTEKACRLLEEAWEVGPRFASIAVEYARTLTEMGRYSELETFVRGLPGDIKAHERIQLLYARAALETGDYTDVERIFAHEFAPIQEGEVTLSDLWFAYQERRLARDEGSAVTPEIRARVRRECPPPAHLDFRMAIPEER